MKDAAIARTTGHGRPPKGTGPVSGPLGGRGASHKIDAGFLANPPFLTFERHITPRQGSSRPLSRRSSSALRSSDFGHYSRLSDFRKNLSGAFRGSRWSPKNRAFGAEDRQGFNASWPALRRPSTRLGRVERTGRRQAAAKSPYFLRVCGGEAWMAGTSPAMTTRDRRQASDHGRPSVDAIRANC